MSNPNHTMTERWLTGSQETQFYTRTYTPSTSPKAVIVFLHGFAEHVGRYAHIHPVLAERGVAIFTFDQRGFGRTALDKEHKSKTSAWGRTGWTDQLEDVNWAIGVAKKEFSGIPVFIMGHSMGGGEALGFATTKEQRYTETVASLAGVIATSPLIEQTTPVLKLVRWLGGKAAIISPYMVIPAVVERSHLSHNAAANEANAKDPLIRQSGSLRGVGDMLTEGEKLITEGCNNWPKKPVLFLHGTDDKVTSYKATQRFHDLIRAEDKKIILYPDQYHELQNEAPEIQQQYVNDIVSFVEAHILSTSTAVVEP
ncbi:Alpha/Beta hydrolase protein [Rhodocollybia butyracea]|uniref:Alpha/Beta hydrolase protein n=1 Tax=Rhodocollybia butyracea TaxID=206335 RepID=A0A9P5Q328_9AGAR|nr:Alpha/Beta hydrolase protein [Rhodocollybia butyracea]